MWTFLLKAVFSLEFLQLVLATLTMSMMYAWRGHIRNKLFWSVL